MTIRSKALRIGGLSRALLRMCMAMLASPFNSQIRQNVMVASRVFGVYKRTPKLSQSSALELMPNDVEITLRHCISEDWQVTAIELSLIVTLATHRQPNNIFEFGTFDGRTTLNLHLNCPKARIHTLDLPPGNYKLPFGKTVGTLIADRIREGKITQLFGNSKAMDLTDYFASQQFIFIDADHTYPAANIDTQSALNMLTNQEGVIVWHDYAHWPDVTQAVDEAAEMIASDVTFYWLKDTSLAVMATAPGMPLKLKADNTLSTRTL